MCRIDRLTVVLLSNYFKGVSLSTSSATSCGKNNKGDSNTSIVNFYTFIKKEVRNEIILWMQKFQAVESAQPKIVRQYHLNKAYQTKRQTQQQICLHRTAL